MRLLSGAPFLRTLTETRRTVLAWAVVLATGAAALALLGYRARDPDSRLYAEISARMSSGRAAEWIAPDFPPGWYMSGAYREHPAGLFWPAALLARIGHPADQAAYALNMLYQALSLVALQRLAATLAPGLESRALGWILQLLPIAFTFRIRANQEQAVLLYLVLALLGTERSREHPRWAALTIVGLVGLLLVKGVLAVFGPALCALWLLTRPGTASRPSPSGRGAWIGLAAGVLAMAAAAAAYELHYRGATGQPFWSVYLSRQLGVAAEAQSAAGLAQKAYNLVWYLGRVLWFPFPWSLTLLAAAWHRRRFGASGAGALFVAGTIALYVGLFSLSDRRADRYIFPVYYAVGALGAVAALRTFPRLRRLAERLDRPWVPAVVFAAAFLFHLLAGRLGVPTIKFWAPDA